MLLLRINLVNFKQTHVDVKKREITYLNLHFQHIIYNCNYEHLLNKSLMHEKIYQRKGSRGDENKFICSLPIIIPNSYVVYH